MKKNILAASLMLVVTSLASVAQQLPNASFEEDWGECTPWTSGSTKATGTTPGSWTIAQVAGIGGLGATIVGQQAEGRGGEGTFAVILTNTSNPLVKKQIVPGYITLGTPWNTAKGIAANNKDGGAFGGIEFACMPDELSFWYKRTHGESDKEEVAQVVAYSWTGQWSQADVPGEVSLGSPKTATLIDRDRNILGMEAAQGGEITKTDDAKLIAKLQYSIEGDKEDWTNVSVPFEYIENAAPEKINVIFSANDYFSTTPKGGNSLTVDDVTLVYYSRLSSLKVSGVEVADFDSDKFQYEAEMPDSEADITYEVKGKSAKATVSLDKAQNKATITVENIDADKDGEKQHVYTLTLKGGQTSGIEGVEVDNENAPVEYYTVNGVKVSGELAPGLYLRRQGTKITKVVVK
ncbi:MAG: PCMD domain-containing protein [Muribaculaceae bacterium]|nr:PCMD domain-containing protein [Muribaculaceae bacterium]